MGYNYDTNTENTKDTFEDNLNTITYQKVPRRSLYTRSGLMVQSNIIHQTPPTLSTSGSGPLGYFPRSGWVFV